MHSFIRPFLLAVILVLVAFFLLPIPVSNASTVVWEKSNGINTLSGELRIAPSDNKIVYVTTGSGSSSYLYKSVDGGQNFSIVLTLPTNGNINSVAISRSNPNKIWVGTYDSRSIYRSSDGGLSWNMSSVDNKNVRHVAVDPNNDLTVYAATGATKDGGVYKSTDGGISWTRSGFSTFGNSNSMYIVVDKTNSQRILADNDSQTFPSDLYQSYNGGNSWSRLFLGVVGVPTIVIDENNSTVIYASANGNINKSIDNGLTWLPKSSDIGVSFFHRLTQDADGTLFATRRDNCGGVWMSKDRSESWSNIADSTWGCRGSFGLDARDGKVVVNVEGLGTYYTSLSAISPVVLIPGLGGSWSYKGLVENQKTTYADWKLLPVWTENYQALLSTLKNAGLTENQSLFTFAYDWRQPVVNSGVWLNDYLTNVVLAGKPAGTKANVVGHSLGGLVARACIEKVTGCKDKINKFVSVGTPHTGAVDAYYMWEGGEIPDTNFLRRTMEQTLLRINAKSFAHPKDIVQNIIPSIRDILPNFDYISGKSYAAMSDQAKNKFLAGVGLDNTKGIAAVLFGNTQNTSQTLTVTTPSSQENKMGLWVDGKPTGKNSGFGDDTVLATSAQISGGTNFSFNASHFGLVSDNLPQQKILDLLGLSGTITLPATPANKGLIFFLRSPATLTVLGGTQIDNKTVFIPNPTSQNYPVTITGTGTGTYELEAGSFTSDNQVWQKIVGITSPGKTETQSINYSADKPLEIKPVDTTGLVNLTFARQKIQNITGLTNAKDLLARIDKIAAYINKGSFFNAKTGLEDLYTRIFSTLAKSTNSVTRQGLEEAGDLLINTYEIIISNGNINIPAALVQIDISRGQNTLNTINNRYKTVLPTALQAQNYLEAVKRLNKANAAYASNLLPRAFMFSKSVPYYFQ